MHTITIKDDVFIFKVYYIHSYIEVIFILSQVFLITVKNDIFSKFTRNFVLI